ncbi:prephenate dehydrogenase [Microlunatus ginsengisoli]|uniref:Prephenate dehydrogenase n=1 Tax=Microlunatus ginsengisoli TaxID=363863 RepID=A0ABP7AEZ0_9ACTN
MSREAVVVGAGLIGTSIGLALTAAGWGVHLRDRVISHARVAEGLGAGTVDPPVSREVALVVVAVPPRALGEAIGHALHSYPCATVTDVGSVKAGVLAALWDRQAGLERYVGSHPMAGSQHSGPLAARADLFADRTWVITPHRRSAPSSVAVVHELVQACGAREVVMDVEEHDAAVASVSHLPQLMSTLTAGTLTDVPDTHLALAGPGLRDVTRIAASDPVLWEQIIAANQAAVLDRLRGVRMSLDTLITAIESTADRDELRRQFERGVDGTRKIPGKHGRAPATYGQVVVEIPDAPGALAKLFADVGAAGVNVEDIAIEHDQVRQVGYLALSVTPDQVAGLERTMRDGGWVVSS